MGLADFDTAVTLSVYVAGVVSQKMEALGKAEALGSKSDSKVPRLSIMPETHKTL